MESRIKRICDDYDAYRVIRKLLLCDVLDEAEDNELACLLDDYQIGLLDEIRESDEERSPEDILRRAREKNKPLLL
ncbi:hypothetical protein OAN22_02140 [Alphaproteobacteria bacterium]|nr:hypothetical protein [Alphaproteobacteria bacterium]